MSTVDFSNANVFIYDNDPRKVLIQPSTTDYSIALSSVYNANLIWSLDNSSVNYTLDQYENETHTSSYYIFKISLLNFEYKILE